jgi:phosphoglycerol transferase MdoB-like AlkP superfamily enzyme
MFFLPSAHTVYTGSINKKQDSIVSYLNKNNFNTIAISGADRNVWSVEKAYQALQFKEYYFEDDLTIEQNENTMLNGHIRDIEMYKELIKHYEQNSGNQFYFLTTMQNHAYYDKMENPTIIADKYATNKELQTYLNLIQHTDEDIMYLIDYFKNSDKDVTIAMFGDHFPYLKNIYNNNEIEKLKNEPLALYQTPFFIWNNKRPQSQYNDMISLNYLSNEVFKVAELPLSKQQQEIEYIRQTYPLICAFGYITADKQDTFMLKSNVVTEITEPILYEYWCYQYNNMTKEETK